MIGTSQLAIVVLGLVSGISLIVMERMNAHRSGEIDMLLNGAANQADRILAGFGDRLRPIYEIAATAETLIDEETDLAVRELSPEVIEAAQTIIDFTKRFTDGKPPAPAPEVADTSPVAGESRP